MKLPLGPNSPNWLQNIQWIVDPISYLEGAAQKYGDIFTAPLGFDSSPLVCVSNPQGNKQILANDTEEFAAPGKSNRILAPLLGYTAAFMLDGEAHKKRRKLLMPPFHGEKMQAYGDLICQLTKQAICRQKTNKIFSARTLMQDISLQVILKVVFGIDIPERYEQIKQRFSTLLDLFQLPLASSLLILPPLQKDLGPLSPWGYFLRLQRQVDKLLYAEISKRRQQNDPNRTDILSLLMSARDEDGQLMSDLELRDELLALLFAGHETTASAMAWSLYWIHHLPEVREKLLREIDELGESPDPMSIVKLPYLSAVCNETLRIYPVAMFTFSRQVKEPVDLMGYQLEPDTAVAVCIYLTHQREDLYPAHKQFRPERFLERNYSPYEFMPFGGGVRRCVGDALAQFEMKLVLATILSSYELALAHNQPIKPRRRGITLAPGDGVPMLIKGKRSTVRLNDREAIKTTK